MTPHKPPETFEYLVKMNTEMNLNVKVFLVADEIPKVLKDANIDTILLPTTEFKEESAKCSKEIYFEKPDLCCKLLKVDPTKEAVKNLDLNCLVHWFEEY